MDLNGKKIMITNCCGLGDLIMFTPALRRLKQKFPSCHVTFLCRDNHRDVLSRLSYVDKVVCIYRGKFLGRYRAIPALLNQDAVIFTDWHPLYLFFAKIFRIPLIAGYGRANHSLTKCITKKLTYDEVNSTDYRGNDKAKVFSEALDINLDGDMTKLEISPPQAEDVQSVNKMLENIGLNATDKYILLMPFTGLEQKNIPADKAAEFVHAAEAKYKLPVIVAGPSSRQAESQKISRYTLTGATTLSELVEIISRAEILVTSDSGQMHVAGAVRKNCVALFTTGRISSWAPKTNCITLSMHLPCSPCTDETAGACPHVNCMRGITVEMMLDACDKFLLENFNG